MAIRVLPQQLANQIAAGEVVERPASVVKELVENAVDAGAASVRVEIDGGGVGRIRVTDDGSGMSREDAALCVQRHATSKILSGDDLEEIRTLGFRGEALPSIASVSQFVLRTRCATDLAGTEVRIAHEEGPTPVVSDVGLAIGTQVEVSDLFFNTPARLKFLKTEATESGHAIEAAVRIALGRPEIALRVVKDGRVVRELLKQASPAARVRELFPEEELHGAEGTLDGVTVQGWLSAPQRSRSSSGGLYTFVNGRYVRDRGLLRAIVQSYGGTVEAGRYPEGVLYLQVEPRDVDVNVHPQKIEVRFARPSAILGVTTRVLSETLRASPWSRPIVSGPTSAAAVRSSGGPARPPAKPSWPDTLFGGGLAALRGLGAAQIEAGADPPHKGTTAGLYATLQPIGQLRATYIVCEGPDGLYVLDQHASHERVTFDRLRRAYRAREVPVQRLLFPERLEVSPTLVAVAEERRDSLATLGVEVEPLGADSLALHAVPALVQRADPRRLVLDVLSEVGKTGEASFTAAVDLVLATMACHGSIRAGETLAIEEFRALLASLDEVDFSGNCPHGRPILMTLSWADLERRVGRR